MELFNHQAKKLQIEELIISTRQQLFNRKKLFIVRTKVCNLNFEHGFIIKI